MKRLSRLLLATVAVAGVAAYFATRARSAPCEPWQCPPPPPPPWTSKVAYDTVNDLGSYASMGTAARICSGGGSCTGIHIAHHRKDVGGLYYTTSIDGGATFSTDSIDLGGADADFVGAYAALAVRNFGSPMISYHNTTENDLKLARKVGGGQGNCPNSSDWKCKTVASGGKHSSIGIDADGRVSILHRNNDLRLSFADPPYDTFTHEVVSTKAITSADLVVDTLDQLHVAFTTVQCLFYRYRFSSGWSELETVECVPDGSPLMDAGRVSIVVNSSERPHIAYVSNTSSGGYRVRHAFKVDYQTWSVEHVSFVSQPQAGTSIILDTSNLDTAAISWGSISGGQSRLVVATPANLYGFDGMTIDSPGGAYSSLGRVGGKLAVAHHDPVAKSLRFSKHD